MALKIARVNDRKTSEQYEVLGLKEFAAGNLEKAAAHLLSALELDDKNALLYLRMGTVLLEQGRADKALIAIKRSIELAPYEADAYNAMGVVLFQHEFWGAAEKFFRKAIQLDPEHATAKSSLVETMKRMRAGDNELPAEFGTVLALLETQEPRISLCVIAKDEEQFIGDCLASVRSLVDEIIVVDTGSSDRTVAIAESFGAKVFHFPWTGDFAAARNESLSHATGDWILVLDADEVIPAEGHAELKKAIRNLDNVGYNLVIENLLGETGDAYQTALIFRLFRNRPDIRFEGIIHEQALPSAQRTGEPVQSCPARIVHRGYLDQYLVERDKYQRNLTILLKQAEQQPDEPYVYFNLGQTYKLLGQYAESEKAYQRSLALLEERKASPTTAYWPNLYFSFVDLYRLTGEYEKALTVAEEALKAYPEFPDILFTKGLVLVDLERFMEAIPVFEACRAFKGIVFASGNDPAVPGYKASMALGVAYSRMGQQVQAKRYFLQALEECARPNAELYDNLGIVHLHLGETHKALEFFIKAVERNERDAKAWANIGAICQQLGQHQEALAARQKAHEIAPDQNGFVFGTSLMHLKCYAEAEAIFAREAELHPGLAPAWIYLGLARLCLGKLGDASEAWKSLAANSDVESSGREDGKALHALSMLIAGEAHVDVHGFGKRAGDLWTLVINHLLVAERYSEVEKALSALQGVAVQGAALALGRLLHQRGLHEEALGFLLKAREEAPDAIETYVLLGEAAEALGNAEDAQVMYQMALSLDPKLITVRQKLGRLRLAQPAK